MLPVIPICLIAFSQNPTHVFLWYLAHEPFYKISELAILTYLKGCGANMSEASR